MNIQEEIISHSRQQLRILNKFRRRLDKEKYINNYASNYYGNMHNRLSIPGIIVSGVSSIASFIATSDMMSDTSKTAISIGVGILAAGSTIIYSIANSYGFQSRRDSFQVSADAYDDLITRIEFEIVNPNENFNEFCNSLETQILKIKTDCKYLPPLFIYKMYEEETRKMKLAGQDAEHDHRADNSPARSGIPTTHVSAAITNSNKQIKLPSPSAVIAIPSPVGGDGVTNSAPATYFNELVGPRMQTGTTVNKLSRGMPTNLNTAITIPNQDTFIEPSMPTMVGQTLGPESNGGVSYNIFNMDAVEMEDASSV